jgi:hypothetical protein
VHPFRHPDDPLFTTSMGNGLTPENFGQKQKRWWIFTTGVEAAGGN